MRNAMLPQTERLLELISEYVGREAKRLRIARTAVRFTQRGLRKAIGWGDRQLRRRLERLGDGQLSDPVAVVALAFLEREGPRASHAGPLRPGDLVTGDPIRRQRHVNPLFLHRRHQPPRSFDVLLIYVC